MPITFLYSRYISLYILLLLLVTSPLPSHNIPPAPPQGGSCREVSIRVEYWILECVENQCSSSTFSNSPLEGG